MMANPLTEEELCTMKWVREYLLECDYESIVENTGLSMRTLMRVLDNKDYKPSRKTLTKLHAEAVELIDAAHYDSEPLGYSY